MIRVLSFEERPSQDLGFFDECQEWEGSRGLVLRLAGWARDPASRGPAQSVVIVDERSEPIAEAHTHEVRVDVAQASHAPALTQCGWSVFIPKSALSPGTHLLSAFTVSSETGVAYRLSHSFRVRIGNGPAPVGILEDPRRPATRQENERLNREEQALGRTMLASYPTLVLLELTAQCNLNCLMCGRYNTDLNGHISDELYELVKTTLYPLASMAILSCRAGEPVLYPKFDRAVEDVRMQGLQGVLTTNATVLKPEHIRQLVDAGFEVRFSVDGATPRTYHTVRGAALSTVARHVQQFVAYARSSENSQVRTGVTFTPMMLNIHELADMVDLAAGWGVDGLFIQKFGVHNAYTNGSWSPENDPEQMKTYYNEALRRAVQRNITLEIAGARLHERKTVALPEAPMDGPAATPPPVANLGCTRPFSDAIVYMDGAVVPCCFGAPPMGYLKYQTFDEIWNGEKWRELRRGLAEGDPPDYCRRCDLLKSTGREPRPVVPNPFRILSSAIERLVTTPTHP